ncbi:membrane protein [Caballeronia hypogeia]|uniref:Membrane protein n=1 Tax=Caballeronia hypogeia TaxID=1777140 RepID=A0A158DUC6_9BURK|nr:DUF4148 domain-containing protein [Caballeronia hypogeia]SAK98222.1 membrane protein [Caballeronia hypogeia]
MKPWVNVAVAAVVLSAPLVSFAQSSVPMTRAAVRAQLVILEKAGYSPAAEDASYPAKLEAAEIRVADLRLAQAQAEGYGASTGGASQSGSASKRIDPQSVFFGQ